MQAVAQEQYVEFGIELERYAIRIEDIHEIIKLQAVTKIPNTLPYVKGVIHLRGKILSVISLRNLFGLHEKEYGKTTRIIVVKHHEDMIGIIVDSVSKVAVFSDIEPPPEHVRGVDGSFFVGLGLSQNDLVGILNLDEVLLH